MSNFIFYFFFLSLIACGTTVITRPIVFLRGAIWLHKWKFSGGFFFFFEAVPKATWVISIFSLPTSLTALPLCSPEHSNQRGVNGVSIVDVHVVPAALCGKVIEAQPEHCIRAARQGEKPQCSCEKIHLTDRYYFHIFCFILLVPTSECLHYSSVIVCSYGRTLTLQGLEKLFSALPVWLNEAFFS